MPASGKFGPETDQEMELVTQESTEETEPSDVLLAEPPAANQSTSNNSASNEETDNQVPAAASPRSFVKRLGSYLQRLPTAEFWLMPHVPEIDFVFWFFYFLSIILFVAGFAINTDHLVEYAKEGHWYYFSILCVSMILPHLAINLLSHFWRANDYANRKESMPWYEKFLCPVAGFIFLTWDTGSYAWKIHKRKEFQHYHYAFLRQADRAHIQLINTFISSGPQLILKVYRLINEEWGSSMTGSDVCFAILTAVSLAISSTSASLNSKRIRHDKKDICYAGAALQSLHIICLLATRVTALACLFSLHKVVGLATCSSIVVGCWIWLTCFKSAQTDVMKTKMREYFYRVTIAISHLFYYVNVPDGSALKRYAAYYTISFFFDTSCLTAFACIKDCWAVILLIPFWPGIVLQLLNYILFHPASGRLYRSRKVQDWEVHCPHCRREGMLNEVLTSTNSLPRGEGDLDE